MVSRDEQRSAHFERFETILAEHNAGLKEIALGIERGDCELAEAIAALADTARHMAGMFADISYHAEKCSPEYLKKALGGRHARLFLDFLEIGKWAHEHPLSVFRLRDYETNCPVKFYSASPSKLTDLGLLVRVSHGEYAITPRGIDLYDLLSEPA